MVTPKMCHFIYRQDPGNFQDDDESSFDFAHALNELSPQIGTECRRRFDFRRQNFDDLIDGIHNDADISMIAFIGHFNNDNTGPPAGLRLRTSKPDCQINDRHHAAT